MSQDLPAGLAEPLHILEPAAEEGGCLLPGLLALFVLAGFLLLWRRWRARRSASGAPVPDAPDRSDTVGPLGRISRIRKRYLHRGDRRQGCHELGVVVREALEREIPGMVASAGPGGGRAWRRRPRLETLTGREIAALVEGALPEEGAAVRFLPLLELQQFGRVAPDRETFAELCDLAAEAVRELPGGAP